MLQIGRHATGSCGGISRRAFVQAGSLAPLAMAAAAGGTPQATGGERAAAKSVILIWLWGGPSHLDLVDPKPEAPLDIRGPFASIATRLPGVHFAETLPRLAARNDQFALVRSNVNFQQGHLEAGTLGLSAANLLTAIPEPHFGAVLAKTRGYGSLPPFVAVGNGPVRDVVGLVKGQGGGRWGEAHDPFRIRCDDLGTVEIPALQLIEGQTPQALADRTRLRESLDLLRSGIDQVRDERLGVWDKSWQRACDLLTSPEARAALDLGAETDAVRQSYGYTTFGQSCLLARRLVEADVPFVQVNWSTYVEAITPNCDFGWDTHIWNFELLQDRHGPIFDRAAAALLDDLRDRGLLDSTLVLMLGEFGRTPRINGQMARDHWPGCYFSIWAGAGVKSGIVVGRSDKTGSAPATTPVTPLDVGATVLELAGLSLTRRIEMQVTPNARVIEELLA